MSPGCCNHSEPPAQPQTNGVVGDKQVWDDGRFAVRHNCAGCSGSELCIGLLDKSKNFLGCYSIPEYSKVLLKDLTCFKPCEEKKCKERRPHIHGYLDHCKVPTKSGSYADQIREVCLLKCACTTPPSPKGSLRDAGKLSDGKKDGIHEDSLSLVVSCEGTTVMNVSGICCPSEVPIIERILKKLPGVEKVIVNVTAKTTTVEHNPLMTSPAELVAAVNTASLGASLKRGDEEPHHSGWPSPLLVLCGFLWVVSLGHIAADQITDEEYKTWVNYLKYVAIAAVVIGFPRIALKAFGALKNRILDINCLMIIASSGAVAIGDYSEAAAVVFLFGLSEWLEDIATAKARNALSSLLKMKPENATFAKSCKTVPVEQVKIGDVLAVRAGEKVPVDGSVIEGSSSVDEAALTGESAPVEKRKGAKVSAGSINVGGGYMEVECTAVAKHSAVARMVRLIEDAHASRSRTEKRVETFAKIYTPVVVIVALGLATVPWIFLDQEEALEWVYTALVLLVVSCPCALVISTPVTYVSTLSTAATHNILIRGGEHLETLGRIRAIGLDKTGTLTEGRFAVRKVLGPFAGQGVPQNMQQLLSLMAAVEQKSTHPVAAALVAHARSADASLAFKADDMVDTAGEGVSATVNGVSVQVGSRRLAKRMGWGMYAAEKASKACLGPIASLFTSSTASPGDLMQLDSDVQTMEESGYTVCYLGVAGQLALVFGVSDAPRPEAAQAVIELKKYGVETVMLTGDRQLTATAIAKMLGITNIRAELLPENKVEAVAQLKQDFRRRGCFGYSEGQVAMVGDGINDAAALAASSVGIAMGAAGTQVAMENAHVVLMDSDLLKLSMSVRLGRYAVTKIKQNITFAMVSKIVMLAITLAGYASLWGAILADLGAMLLVTLNASMVLGERKKAPANHGHGHSHGGGHAHGPH
jgi:Cd2+/Zn2+-exporting ATPase